MKHLSLNKDAKTITIDVGQWNRVRKDSGEFRVEADLWVSHPFVGEFNGISNDIAMIKVPRYF